MSHPILYQIGRRTMQLYARLLLEMDVVHQSPLPGGPKIIAPNHPTTLDPFLVTTYLDERIHILVTESAFKAPLFGRYLHAAGHIPVVMGEGRPAFEAAKNLLLGGHTIAIFPEGALSPLEGGFCRAHTGVARLALLTGAAVVPVGIGLQRERIRLIPTGIGDAEGREEIARFYARGCYAVTTGAPLVLDGDVEDRERVQLLTAMLMGRIKNLSQRSTDRIPRPAASVYDTAEIRGV